MPPSTATMRAPPGSRLTDSTRVERHAGVGDERAARLEHELACPGRAGRARPRRPRRPTRRSPAAGRRRCRRPRSRRRGVDRTARRAPRARRPPPGTASGRRAASRGGSGGRARRGAPAGRRRARAPRAGQAELGLGVAGQDRRVRVGVDARGGSRSRTRWRRARAEHAGELGDVLGVVEDDPADAGLDGRRAARRSDLALPCRKIRAGSKPALEREVQLAARTRRRTPRPSSANSAQHRGRPGTPWTRRRPRRGPPWLASSASRNSRARARRSSSAIT